MRERMSRFATYMQIKGLNDNQVTMNCGLAVGLLTQARKGKSDLGLKTINAILDKYQDINKEWLLTGEGEMLRGDHPEICTKEDKCEVGDSLPLVPLFNLDVMGGFCDNIEQSGQYIDRLIPWENAHDGDFAVITSGTSMMPVILPGSLVLLRKVEGWREFLEYDILYVLELRDLRRILKLVRKSSESGTLTLISYNPNNPPQDISIDFIDRIYKVVSIRTNYGF